MASHMLDPTEPPGTAPNGETMRKAILTMPRLNANEDEAVVATIALGEGDSFEQDAQLFAIETTKAANDVLAPCAGRIERLLVREGDMVAVGAPICEVWFAADASTGDLDVIWADSLATEIASAVDDSARISAKARLRAQELGVAIESVPPDGGRVRVEDVERYARSAGAASAKPNAAAAPALLSRYGAGDAVIVGAAGHAKALIDAAQGCGFTIIGGVDAAIAPGASILGDIAVLGDEGLLDTLRDRGLRTAFIGVGGATSNAVRKRVFTRLVAAGFDLPSLVATSAHLGLGSSLGAATYLFPGANVGPSVRIGDNCIINQNAVVAHDSVIGDHVHLAPNAVVAGHCRIGDGSTLGMCATLLYAASIGADCLIHNTVSITQDVPDGSIVSLARSSAPQPRDTG